MSKGFMSGDALWLVFGGLVMFVTPGEASPQCVYLFESARVPCLHTTQSDCHTSGCCWDEHSRDSNVKCYQKDCKPGYFGWGCRFRCNCKDQRPCNRTSGVCPTGCPTDNWGTGCVLDNNCAYNDYNYEHYVGHMTKTENDHVCGNWTKQRAYPGNQFPDGSREAAKNYCRNPKPLDYRTWCYYWEGNVKDWDYCKLRKCDCPSGMFGTNCQKECHCKNRGEPCHQTDGTCGSGCDPHWTGDDCQACADGYFGPMCSGQCHCRDSSCDKVSGVCSEGCAQGWMGDSCQTECQDGYYGYSCVSQCNCANPSEACDKATGACVSGCQQGYSGVNCQIEVPVLTRAPSATLRQATALSITWPEWRNPPDRGDGPVIGYYLYYRKLGDIKWTSVREDNRFLRLTSLPLDTEYQFKVLTVHNLGSSDFASPTLNTSTCGRPRAGPENVDIRATESTRSRNQDNQSGHDTGDLTVTWRLPRPPLLWGCENITRYKVYYKKLEAELYENIMEVPGHSAILRDVDVYSNYTVAVSLVNSAALESELSVAHYIGKSGPVQDLAALSTNPNTVKVTWEPPSHSNGNILYYVIRYRELRIGNCEAKSSTWTPKVDVDPDQKEFWIQALHPYSQYGIRVWAHTDAGKGQFSMASVTTMADVPAAPVTGLEQRSLTSQFASFSWDLLGCDQWNGEFEGFRYELMDRTTDRLERQDVINQTQLELSGLIPYTDYSLQISFLNHAYEGPKTEPLTFSTFPDIPPAPTHLRVTITTSMSLAISWNAPYPRHGELDKSELRYWSMKSLQPPINVTIKSPITAHILEELKPNTTYGIEVRAYTTVGPGPWTPILQAHTEEDVPSAPTRFQNISRTTSSITFRWGPPEHENGILQTYKIFCSPQSLLGRYLAQDLEKEVSYDTLDYQVTGLRSGTGYVCTLQAATRKGYGPQLRQVFFTKPKVPSAPSVPELKAAESTDTTVTIQIHPSDMMQLDTDHTQTVYRIVVELLERPERDSKVKRNSEDLPCGIDNSQLPGYQVAFQSGARCYVAAEIVKVDTGTDFVIGDNQTYGVYYNAPLEKGQKYGIWYGLVLTVDGVSSAAYTKINEPVVVEYVDENAVDTSMAFAGAGIGAVVAVIILIVVIVILLYRKKKTGRAKMEDRSQATDTDRLDGSSGVAAQDKPEQMYLPDLCASHLDEDTTCDVSETSPLCDAVPATDSRHKAILVDHLWNYVQEKKANKMDGLRQEYEEIPLGLQHLCEVAREPEHKFKNRYGNIVAYDHSRVPLQPTPDDPHSDYINANYIDGYCKPNAFIATQGPSKYTLNDIWRMAWQQNSRRIVMVTNLVEDGRLSLCPTDTANQGRHRLRSHAGITGSVEHKCEQYWPDSTEPVHYDDIVVDLIDTEQFADFVIRTFTMAKDGIIKTVHQLHFTAWPDHGVPNYATSLLTFRKKVRALDDPTAGPTIVHCSAGVGRTGTYIAIDYLIDQARVEGQVDVFHYVQAMRVKRVNMVQTQEQYDFVYDALLEALKSGDTSIPCNSFRRRFKQLLEPNAETGKVPLEEEFLLLGTMLAPLDGAGCRDALTAENAEKNRFKDIIPVDNISRAYLITCVPGSTDYINAVFVDGYKQRDAFIITQMPLPETVGDFWALIYDQDCRTIIMMNELESTDTTCACYYPQDVGTENHGPFSIETISIDTSNPDVVVRDFSLTYIKRGSNETRDVRQFLYTGWPEGSLLPETKSSVITLLGLVEKWQQRSGNHTIVTHCLDGATKSGLFCDVSYMVERLKVEQEVDVFQSTRHTRLNRPQIIPSLDQYKFVYEMAIEYMDCFETYSNFK